MVATEGIYCEFKSCYRFVVFFSLFLSYADQRLRVSLSLTPGYNILFAEPSSMWSEYRTVVSVALVIMVFAGPYSPVFLVSVCWLNMVTGWLLVLSGYGASILVWIPEYGDYDLA